MPIAIQAGLWGLLAGAALVGGAGVAWVARVPTKVIATVMAFGAGVLISALAFDLVEEAARTGGAAPAILGFLAGSVVYVAANVLLARRGARHRKRSAHQQPSEQEQGGSGAAIALGALLDGVPESVALGLTVLTGGGVGVAMVTAIFISNVPEGLSSAAGMKNAGRSARYVFGVWIAIAVASGLAALAGAALLDGASAGVTASISAFAGGAILAMISDTMIPEAFESAHILTGGIATLGFLAAFALEQVG